jgi:hypothetical protein
MLKTIGISLLVLFAGVIALHLLAEVAILALVAAIPLLLALWIVNLALDAVRSIKAKARACLCGR